MGLLTRLSTILGLSFLLAGCSGGFPDLMPGSFFESATSEQSFVVDHFSQTCLANPKSLEGIKEAAEQTGWKESKIGYLKRNGFGGVSEHIKSLSYASNARAHVYHKNIDNTKSVLFFYKLRVNKKRQVRCEIYTQNKNRKKLYNALASRLNTKPFRQNRSPGSHMADWNMNEVHKNVLVRYYYTVKKEQFFNFKGTLLWTYASA